MSLPNILLVALGGAIGAVARYFAVSLIGTQSVGEFPKATFAINMIGSLLIGIAISAIDESNRSPEDYSTVLAFRLLIVVGVLGGFTTFSSFSFEFFDLLKHGKLGIALLYSFGSLLIGLLFVWIGIYAFKFIVDLYN